MAMKRRSPGALPPKLTAQQRQDAERWHPIARRVASYSAKRCPPGLSHTDLLSEAEEALVVGLTTHNPSKGSLEQYLWARVRQSLKNLIRKKAEELGLRAPGDTHESRIASAGREGLDAYGAALEDPGNIWEDEHEDLVKQWEDMRDEGAAALATGGAGHVWHMRGDEGFAQRAEDVRKIRVLREEVAGLPAQLATIMELRFFREQQIDEVAAVAGVSGPTVTRMIGEAIQLLRARLKARRVTDAGLDGS